MGRTKEFEINEVLDKAVQLFWKQGYEKTSMQDLVDFMGIHRRSIYGTFGDKHALYMKALKRYESTQNKKLRLLVERQEPVGCFIVNSGVELGVLDPEVASLVRASLEPEAISHYLMNAWLGLRTMVKTATEQRKLTSIMHTILNTLD